MQQIGTPLEIYDRPANTFVASFIGSPAMKPAAGHDHRRRVRGRARGASPASTARRTDRVTLGFRAEDARVAETGRRSPPMSIRWNCWAMPTMATVQAGGGLVAIKAAKGFFPRRSAHPSRPMCPPGICHLFDAETGLRIDR